MTLGKYPKGLSHMLSCEPVAELLRYLLQHPECTRKQIMQDTQLSISDVSQFLPRLVANGTVTTQLQRRKHLYSVSGRYSSSLSCDLLGGRI